MHPVTMAITSIYITMTSNGSDGVSNHQPDDCLLNRLFGRRTKKTLKLHVSGLCAGNSLVTGEFPSQRASNAENVSIWWRHHDSRGSGDYHPLFSISGKSVPWADETMLRIWGSDFHSRLCGVIFYQPACIHICEDLPVAPFTNMV